MRIRSNTLASDQKVVGFNPTEVVAVFGVADDKLSLSMNQYFALRFQGLPFCRKNANQGCSLFEMLDKFTAAERLDGGRVYSCSYCNNVHLTPSRGE